MTDATDDIRLSLGFLTHRKTKRLRRTLGDAGVLYLLKLWTWAAAERWTGDLAGMTDEDIELEVDWEGVPGAFVAALAEPGIRFLDGPPGARELHEWPEHQPYACHRGARIVKARKAARSRWDKVREEQAERQDELPLSGDTGGEDATSMEFDARSNAQDVENDDQAMPSYPTPTPTKSECARAADEAATTVEALKRAGCPDATALRVADVLGKGVAARALVEYAQTKKGAGKSLAYLATWILGDAGKAGEADRGAPAPATAPREYGPPPSVVEANRIGEALRGSQPGRVQAVLERARAELGEVTAPSSRDPPELVGTVTAGETPSGECPSSATGGRNPESTA